MSKNITQLVAQTGSADPTSLLYSVTGTLGNYTDKSLPLSVLYHSPTFSGTTNFSGSLQGAATTSITLPGNGAFYAPTASVSRIQDRLFVGPAALNNATSVAAQPDWLTTYQIAKGRTYGYIQTSQFAALNSGIANSQTTIVSGAQVGPLNGGAQVIALTGIGTNNASSGSSAAWGGYYEGYRDTTGTGSGGAYGIEIDTMNYVNVADSDPYSQNNNQTVTLQIAAGGGYPAAGQFPSTSAINIQNNNSTYDKGIVIGSNAITGATGSSGTGIAMAMGIGHIVQWYGAAATPTSSIVSNGTTTTGGLQQVFSENTVSFNNNAGRIIFEAIGVSSGVNGLVALGAATGQNPALGAVGTDTNIPIQFNPKGSGSVVANGPLTANGAVTFTSGTINGTSVGATTPSTGAFTTISATSTITPSQTAGIVGTTTNNNANTGSVGEYISNSTTGVSLTTATPTNVTSISLTAGDWDVEGTVTFIPANTTAPTLMQCGTNTTSATFGGLGTQSFLSLTFPTTGVTQGFIAPKQRISIAATTTVYMVAQSSFTVSTMTANGFIRARRVR